MPAFHLLAKPTGAQCNLDCDYCFFLSKEMLYPDSRFRMSDEQLEDYLRQLIEAHAHLPEVTIAWQGGEPTLMGLDFFRRSVQITSRLLKPGQRALHTIQTNGTQIDEEWAQFFKENDYLVGISIDGPQQIHDAYRVTQGGRGSFDKVMRGARASSRGRRRVQHAHDAARGQRREQASRSTASCAMSAGRAFCSSSRSSSASRRRRTTAPCPGPPGATGRCMSSAASMSPGARSRASSTGGS